MPPQRFIVEVDGRAFSAYAGQSLISVFIENKIFALKVNQVTGEPRFGICGMGTCFECEVHIEGKGIRRSCMLQVSSDLCINTGVSENGDQ